MNIQTFSESRSSALAKWKEYRQAEKRGGGKMYVELKKLYNQIKTGRKIIDISAVIKAGGVHDNGHPKLAVAQASARKIHCRYRENGDVVFHHDRSTWRFFKNDMQLPGCLPVRNNSLYLEAPVPLIPPKILPVNLTSDYYILWEVDEWKMVAPTDPFLLRRITKNHFVVLEGWDLTELEKSVMNANL